MSASFRGKIWCYPEELLNHELVEAIEYLWELYAFEDGSDMVLNMIRDCENEYNVRLWMKSRVKNSWHKNGYPKPGKPVIEMVYEPREYRVVRWNINFLGSEAYTYTKEHHYDPDETNP